MLKGLEDDEVLGGDVGDADGDTGVAEEGDDNAMTADALDLSLDAGEGTTDDANGTAYLVDELVVGEGDALQEGSGRWAASMKFSI